MRLRFMRFGVLRRRLLDWWAMHGGRCALGLHPPNAVAHYGLHGLKCYCCACGRTWTES